MRGQAASYELRLGARAPASHARGGNLPRWRPNRRDRPLASGLPDSARPGRGRAGPRRCYCARPPAAPQPRRAAPAPPLRLRGAASRPVAGRGGPGRWEGERALPVPPRRRARPGRGGRNGESDPRGGRFSRRRPTPRQEAPSEPGHRQRPRQEKESDGAGRLAGNGRGAGSAHARRRPPLPPPPLPFPPRMLGGGRLERGRQRGGVPLHPRASPPPFLLVLLATPALAGPGAGVAAGCQLLSRRAPVARGLAVSSQAFERRVSGLFFHPHPPRGVGVASPPGVELSR